MIGNKDINNLIIIITRGKRWCEVRLILKSVQKPTKHILNKKEIRKAAYYDTTIKMWVEGCLTTVNIIWQLIISLIEYFKRSLTNYWRK